MRLDKYLKVARILKRRTVANELASNQRVRINGKISKPSSNVNINDEIEVTFGNRRILVKVLSIEAPKKKDDSISMYEILEESIIKEENSYE